MNIIQAEFIIIHYYCSHFCFLFEKILKYKHIREPWALCLPGPSVWAPAPTAHSASLPREVPSPPSAFRACLISPPPGWPDALLPCRIYSLSPA